jgi:hypothetical protein
MPAVLDAGASSVWAHVVPAPPWQLAGQSASGTDECPLKVKRRGQTPRRNIDVGPEGKAGVTYGTAGHSIQFIVLKYARALLEALMHIFFSMVRYSHAAHYA